MAIYEGASHLRHSISKALQGVGQAFSRHMTSIFTSSDEHHQCVSNASAMYQHGTSNESVMHKQCMHDAFSERSNDNETFHYCSLGKTNEITYVKATVKQHNESGCLTHTNRQVLLFILIFRVLSNRIMQ